MSRGLFSAALGAGAATAYYRPDVLTDMLRDSARAGLSLSRGAAATSARELDQLYKMMEQLSREVKGAKPVTIVHSDRGSNIFIYGVAAAGVGTIVYLTVFRGWRLADLMYVTRRGLREGLAQVNKGLDVLGGRIADVKAKLQARLAELAAKQDEALAAQAALKAQLAGVGGEVESTRAQVGQIHGLVLDMESALTDVGANQRHANHGIYILCKAVGELMQGANIASQAELLHYTQHPIWQAERTQGLEGLLPGSERAGPFLLSGLAKPLAPPPGMGVPGLLQAGSGSANGGSGLSSATSEGREESPAKRPDPSALRGLPGSVRSLAAAWA